MKVDHLRKLTFFLTLSTVRSNSTTMGPAEIPATVEATSYLKSKLIVDANVLIIEESSNNILLIEESQSSNVNVVFKLPTIVSLFDHCAKEDLETIKARIDADAEFQQIQNSAIHLRKSFLAELKRENGYSGDREEISRDRRTTVADSETKPMAAPTAVDDPNLSTSTGTQKLRFRSEDYSFKTVSDTLSAVSPAKDIIEMSRRVHEVQKPTQEQIRASSEVFQYVSETSTAAKSLETTKVPTIAAKSTTT
jgi:hypothetical protein